MSFQNASTSKRVALPKNFTSAAALEFLVKAQEFFSYKGKQVNGFLLDTSKVRECSMLGVLLFYKFIEYTFNNNCFNNPLINFKEKMHIAVKKYGFSDLITQYMKDKKKVASEYKKLAISLTDEFIIAPQALLRDEKYSNEALRDKFLPKIKEYYEGNEKGISMIFSCLSEVLLNFWEHAIQDTKSIIVASGNKNNIEIACADTASGIISTLGPVLNISKEKKEIILLKSIEKGVTSKLNTNHMGYGLWILDRIVEETQGRMHLYSEGCYYFNQGGRKKSGKCGYWQGTIIYISLPLSNPKTIADIENDNTNNIKIDWL